MKEEKDGRKGRPTYSRTHYEVGKSPLMLGDLPSRKRLKEREDSFKKLNGSFPHEVTSHDGGRA